MILSNCHHGAYDSLQVKQGRLLLSYVHLTYIGVRSVAEDVIFAAI